MRVVQLLPTLTYGDAVGNDALALHGWLSQKGYKTLIYAENIDPRVNKEVVKYYTEIPALSEDDILLYHFLVPVTIKMLLQIRMETSLLMNHK